MKKFFFILFMPIMVPIAVFVNATYDWWTELGNRNRFLFILLAPVYAPLGLFMWGLFDHWAKLAE
jgi:hypothetical protein